LSIGEAEQMTKIAKRNRIAGFSLLELVIALAVVAVLAAIAYPSYSQSIINGRRADGKTALVNLGNRMEQYYAQNNTFASATIASSPSTDVLSAAASEQGYYTLTIPPATLTANSYTIQATRAGVQTADTHCGNLTLTSAGVKGIVNNASGYTVADCW
jgi:type IV pilus assembly protein PilE